MPPSPRPRGWYQAGDGGWYETDAPPAPGWWLASDLRWYPPHLAAHAGPNGASDPASPGAPEDAWRWSRWGLGDCWWGVLAYVVGSIVMSFALTAGLLVLDPDTSLDELEFGPYSIAIGLLANVVAFAGVPWLASRRKGLRSLRHDFGLAVRPIDLAIGVGFGIGALVVAGLVAAGLDSLLDLDGDASNVPIDDLHGPGQIAAFAIAIAIVTPIIEELFFRGLLNRSLQKRGAGHVVSSLVTTVAFVLPHLLAQPTWPNIAVLAAVITVYGAAFHVACIVTGNRLGAPIVAHAVVNGVAVIVLATG